MRLFTISIDTEADCSADWTGASPESYKNLEALSTRLLPITEKYGHRPTLLLNGDIIARTVPSDVCATLSSEFGWELGTHLHGEFVSPCKTAESPAGLLLRDFQCGYEPEIEFAKMETLTAMFRERFGHAPTSFRAGRFGAGRTTLEACTKLGYEVDSSVVPGAFLRERTAVADFRKYSNTPIILGSLVEIPVTVKPGVLRPLSPLFGQLKLPGTATSVFLKKLPGRVGYVVDRALAPLNKTTWLRPSYSTEQEMEEVLRWLYAAQEPVVANMMFHSNELLAGASPYNSTDQEVADFLRRLELTLAIAEEMHFVPATLTEAARKIKDHNVLS